MQSEPRSDAHLHNSRPRSSANYHNWRTNVGLVQFEPCSAASRLVQPEHRQQLEQRRIGTRSSIDLQGLDFPDYNSDYHQLSFTQHRPAIVDNDCEPSDSEYATSQEDIESDEETLPMDKHCFAASTKGKATNSNTAIGNSTQLNEGQNLQRLHINVDQPAIQLSPSRSTKVNTPMLSIQQTWISVHKGALQQPKFIITHHQLALIMK